MGARVPLSSPPIKPTTGRTLLWVTRGAAALSLLLVWLGVVVARRSGAFEDAIAPAVLLTPVWLPTLWVLVRLRGARVREGARSAALAAALSLAVTLVVLAVAWEDWGWGMRVGLGAFGLVQVTLGVCGYRLFRAQPAPAEPPPVTADPRWLRRVRGLTLALLGVTLGTFTVLSVQQMFASGAEALWIIPLTVVFWGPYAVIYWWLRGRTLKEGLAIAIGLTPLALLLVLIVGVVVENSTPSRWPLWVLRGFAVIQVALAAVSVRTYYTMRREPGDWGLLRKWLVAFGLGSFLVLILAAMAVPGTLRSRMAANESSAVGNLRTIVTAAITYNTTYGHGFPPALSMLGPSPAGEEASCRAADLLDVMLASGEKSGYRFEYRAQAPAGSAAPGCPMGAASFVAVARPLSLNRTGIRSFFVDESGVVRATSEEREATARDPPVQ